LRLKVSVWEFHTKKPPLAIKPRTVTGQSKLGYYPLQELQELLLQEPQELFPLAPLMGPLLLAAKNNDKARFALGLPHWGQSMGASESFIERRA